MRHDVWKLDRELVALRDRRRAALAATTADDTSPEVDPFASRLFHLRDELSESADPVVQGIVRWLDVMSVERSLWSDRLELEKLWHVTHRVTGLDDPISLAGLRRGMLADESGKLRDAYREGFSSSCGAASDRAVDTLVRRLEREGWRYLAVDGVDLAVGVAERVLAATLDLTEEVPRGIFDQARSAVGAAASEGWPARLTSRWLRDVFAGSGLGDGLDVALGGLPAPWGAMSFARAMGELGTALLDASRSPSVPFSLHKRPRGHRRHARRALFASVVIERPFAKRVLDLGSDRLRDHRRFAAMALCLSIRFDALRVLVTAALSEGEGAGRERFSELTASHFGGAAPARLLGVLPRLRPADGPALVGAALSFLHRAALVDAYDEDWFRNPRAIETIRHQDEGPAGPAPTADDLELAVTELKNRLESAVG